MSPCRSLASGIRVHIVREPPPEYVYHVSTRRTRYAFTIIENGVCDKNGYSATAVESEESQGMLLKSRLQQESSFVDDTPTLRKSARSGKRTAHAHNHPRHLRPPPARISCPR